MTEMQLLEVPIDQIKCREAAPSEELSISLLERGQRDPINVRPIKEGPYRFEIASGNRRFWSLVGQGAETVWVCIIEATDVEFALDALTLNSGTPNFLDEAEQIVTLMEEYGVTKEAIAKSSGMAISTVDFRIRLITRLHSGFQEMMRGGSITYSAALQLLKLPLPRQEKFLAQVKEELEDGTRNKVTIQDCIAEYRAYKEEGIMDLGDIVTSTPNMFDPGSEGTVRVNGLMTNDANSTPNLNSRCLTDLLDRLKVHQWASRTAKKDLKFIEELLVEYDGILEEMYG